MPVYLIQAGETGPVKIGWAKRPEARLRELQTGNGERLRILRLFEGSRIDEARLHAAFAARRLYGEWFDFSPEMLDGNSCLHAIRHEPEISGQPKVGAAEAAERKRIEEERCRGAHEYKRIQCRAARECLDWSQADLAKRSGLGLSTVRNFEKGRSIPSASNLEALWQALEAHGMCFIDPDDDGGAGVLMKRKGTRKSKPKGHSEP